MVCTKHQRKAPSPVQSTKHQCKAQLEEKFSCTHLPQCVCVLQRMNSTPGSSLLLAKMAVNFLSMSTHADLRVSNGETQNWWGDSEKVVHFQLERHIETSIYHYVVSKRIALHHLKCWPWINKRKTGHEFFDTWIIAGCSAQAGSQARPARVALQWLVPGTFDQVLLGSFDQVLR